MSQTDVDFRDGAEPRAGGEPDGAPHPLPQNRRVVLVNPRATYVNEIAQKCFPPMHLLYLAAALGERGFPCEVLDANAFRMTDDAIAGAIRDARPLLVGLSVYSDILRQVRDITRQVRQAAPAARIVLGGPHASAVARQTLEQFPAADFVLVGEAEHSLAQLAEAVASAGRVEQIPGIVFRRDGRIVEGPPPDYPAVESVPRPARHLLAKAYEEKRYYSILVRRRPVDTLFSSRGCPFHCGFCYNFRQKYRYRSADDVVDELTRIRERGIRDVEIADDTFTGIPRRAVEILDRIVQERLDLSLRIKSRVDAFTEELAAKARKAGVYLVAFGMESGSQRMLQAMHKRTTVEMNARACALARKYRMLSHSSWILGYPGETPESVSETLDFIRRYRPSTVNLAVLRPYPKTEAYEIAASTGALVGEWSPDAEELPWVRLPWATDRRILDDLCRTVRRQVYFTPYYAAAFAGQIVRSANWKLAQYAGQEFLRALRSR